MKFEKQAILTLLFICFIAQGTCHKNPTAPKTGTLTGTVYLEGEQDHSGITVALYKLAELDTTILRYNREYPNVGLPISQATEFDHRLGEVAAEAKTKKDGSFEIDGVEEGTYNFVAQKQGYGWKYVYPVRKVTTFQYRDNIMNYMVLGIFKYFFRISNRVYNVQLNSNSTTSLTQLFNNLMNHRITYWLVPESA